ncbi:MAG: hypothetical protein HZA91_13455 [Verrucomicrobia bacterium]|nr:hypothetical protein [Verrucomicrobiota bacterium]
MPKHEVDSEDPMELMGVTLATHEDTLTPMAECFIEEFMRMRFNPEQVLELFKNPDYIGPHMVWEQRGEGFVRQLIADSFAQWGRAANHESRVTNNA